MFHTGFLYALSKKEIDRMARNPFTSEELLELQSNKYVESVTRFNVTFTHEFRKRVLDDNKIGISIRETLCSCGIQPSILGTHRYRNLVRRFVKQSERFNGFDRTPGSGRKKSLDFTNPSEEIQYLKERNEYLAQENEFLKKLRALKKG